MIIGKDDKERVQRLQDMAHRVSEADRWLSEFREVLGPLWDYIQGKRITHVMESGRKLEIMAQGDISRVREGLRKLLNPPAAERGEKGGE
jgi:hypothetical protein